MTNRSGAASRRNQPVTLEQALARAPDEAFEAFARHVNPIEADLFRLAGFDKRYRRAEGLYLHDDAGRRYMDFTAGFGALNLGHNPPEVLAALGSAQSLPNVLLSGYSQLAGALGEALADILPGALSVSCFGSGGAEAVETALKTARAATGRTRFIHCEHAYHGLSYGAMSVSGSVRYRKFFGPLVEHCEAVPYGDLAALEQRLAGGDIAAFIVEPVQGEGGAVAPPEGFLAAAAQICRKFGSLFIVDEIQTGFGRTGRLFAIEHEGVEPDMILLSKSLAAGVVPISACVTTDDTWRRAYGDRDRFDLAISTFGGNAAACAAALKAIEVTLRDGLAERADTLGRHAKQRLIELAGRHDTVRAIHGQGLLLGIELDPPASGQVMRENFTAIVASCLLNEHGLLTTFFDLAHTTLRFEPPLIVTHDEIDRAIDALDRVLGLGPAGLALSVGRRAVGRILHLRGA